MPATARPDSSSQVEASRDRARAPTAIELSEQQLARIAGGPATPLCQACTLKVERGTETASSINQYLAFEDYDA